MSFDESLVLGTTNSGKLRELGALLDPFGISCRSLAGLDKAVEVEETGTSFAENAALKATQQARALDRWVLAEDSGLVVDALGGAPGIYSARFSGPGATDSDNNTLLLERLAACPPAARTAHYACHAALAAPSGEIVARSSGTCHGLIAAGAAGGGGFGYDPLFIVPEYHRTFGELSPAVKAVISHRARAMRAIIPAVVRALWPKGRRAADR
ncbi:MAG: RdgB/HAM1 family non-canonical purine NTP pyrophosphatase [Planctomycetia bacterium]